MLRLIHAANNAPKKTIFLSHLGGKLWLKLSIRKNSKNMLQISQWRLLNDEPLNGQWHVRAVSRGTGSPLHGRGRDRIAPDRTNYRGISRRRIHLSLPSLQFIQSLLYKKYIHFLIKKKWFKNFKMINCGTVALHFFFIILRTNEYKSKLKLYKFKIAYTMIHVLDAMCFYVCHIT